MESSSIPTAGNATTEKQAVVALLRAMYTESRNQFNEIYTQCNELEAIYNHLIIQNIEIKHELQFRVSEASHDIASEDASIYKALLESTQDRIKAQLEQKQIIIEKRAALVKKSPELEATGISQWLAEHAGSPVNPVENDISKTKTSLDLHQRELIEQQAKNAVNKAIMKTILGMLEVFSMRGLGWDGKEDASVGEEGTFENPDPDKD
ncbi:hypothetical protein INS49_000266 [Diaporthe citri]|uniref:uncharacterized protein n=1 Tax=Diaporthe citri TaxID=83186 RepID=UPI001C7F651F|nr:uncharacterized protein INS49_000266 [Diaporthe citri]KAG6366090.1 hypothetical protein INS49_000266 [Diaporthe citri]